MCSEISFDTRGFISYITSGISGVNSVDSIIGNKLGCFLKEILDFLLNDERFLSNSEFK